jgi:hypothetical protein
MRFRLIGASAFAAILAIGVALNFASPAQAQFGMGPSPQDCAMTSGTSRMCVTNNSPFMITGIEAGTFMQPDGHWVPIPGGFIRPGQTVMVNFPVWQKGTCVMNVFAQNWAGGTHMFPGLNVCRSTRIVIGGW